MKEYDKIKEFKKVKLVAIIYFIALIVIGILNVFLSLKWGEEITFLVPVSILAFMFYYQIKLRQFSKMTGESADKFDVFPVSAYNQLKKTSKALFIACLFAGILAVLSIIVVYLLNK